MAAFAFCIDTQGQRSLDDARVVSIITDIGSKEARIIPPCDKTNQKQHVSTFKAIKPP